MKDSFKKTILVAVSLICGVGLLPSAMADQETIFEEMTGVPTVIGPGVTEYRTIRRSTTTMTEPVAPVVIERPVVIENNTNTIERINTTERIVTPRIVYRNSARRSARRTARRHHVARRTTARRVAMAPRTTIQSVKTIERTIEKPIIVEKPVIIDRPVDHFIDRVIDRPVDRIIEKPVVIEKRVNTPVFVDRVISQPVVLEKKKRKHLLNLKVL